MFARNVEYLRIPSKGSVKWIRLTTLNVKGGTFGNLKIYLTKWKSSIFLIKITLMVLNNYIFYRHNCVRLKFTIQIEF